MKKQNSPHVSAPNQPEPLAQDLGESATDTDPTPPVRKRKNRAPNARPTYPTNAAAPRRTSLADTLYAKLRSQIITLQRKPGEPLSENAIAQTEGVSRTPVREAILRLADEQLVEVVPQSGTFVGRIPVSALSEPLIARRALEMLTVRSATRLATPDDIDTLNALIADQIETSRTKDLEVFYDQDEFFHETVARIAQLPRLWQISASVKIQVDRFRILTLPQTGRLDMVVAEHKAIAAAIAQGDENRAAAQMEHHLSGLLRFFAPGIAAFPDAFIHDTDLRDVPDI